MKSRDSDAHRRAPAAKSGRDTSSRPLGLSSGSRAALSLTVGLLVYRAVPATQFEVGGRPLTRATAEFIALIIGAGAAYVAYRALSRPGDLSPPSTDGQGSRPPQTDEIGQQAPTGQVSDARRVYYVVTAAGAVLGALGAGYITRVTGGGAGAWRPWGEVLASGLVGAGLGATVGAVVGAALGALVAVADARVTRRPGS